MRRSVCVLGLVLALSRRARSLFLVVPQIQKAALRQRILLDGLRGGWGPHNNKASSLWDIRHRASTKTRRLRILRMAARNNDDDDDDDASSPGGVPPGRGGETVAKGARVLLAALFAIYASNQWCRSLLFSTVNFSGTADDPIRYLNVALGLSESQYALLGTFAFNALFSAASLAAGFFVDRVDAAFASCAACLLWSLATVALGQTSTFAAAAACRAFQGLAMAVTAPAGYSLLARAYDASNLASANSAYATAVSVGGALASASVVLDEQLGWRAAFSVVGAVGVVVAAVAYAAIVGLQRSRNGALFSVQATEKAPPPKGQPKKTRVLLQAEEERRGQGAFSAAAMLLLATTAIRFCAGFSIAVWALPVFRGAFPNSAAEFGLAYAIVVAACGSASALLGGRVADALAADQTLVSKLPPPFRRNANAARASVPCVGSLLAAPLWLAAVFAPALPVALLFLALEFFVAENWIGVATALLATEVPPSQRGLAQGTFTALTLVGNLAPVAIGVLFDASKRIDALVDYEGPRISFLSFAGGLDLATLVSAAVVLAYLLAALGFAAVAALVRAPAAVTLVAPTTTTTKED